MKGSAGHEKTWVEQVAAAIVVAALFGLLWRPAASLASSGDQAERVAELAALLGDRAPASAAIERILPAATRFPPSAEASHSLAAALAACGMSDVSEPRRVQLARVIYAITTGGDLSRDRLTQMLEEIQETAIDARCSPLVIAAIVDAAHRVARSDPKPRRDWW